MYRHKVQLLQCFKEMCSLVAHPRLLGGGENTVVANKKLPTARWTNRRKKAHICISDTEDGKQMLQTETVVLA